MGACQIKQRSRNFPTESRNNQIEAQSYNNTQTNNNQQKSAQDSGPDNQQNTQSNPEQKQSLDNEQNGLQNPEQKQELDYQNILQNLEQKQLFENQQNIQAVEQPQIEDVSLIQFSSQGDKDVQNRQAIANEQEQYALSMSSGLLISMGRNSILRSITCFYCNQTIHDEYLNLSCNHVMHNYCFSTLLQTQNSSQNTIFTCICNTKISPTLVHEKSILDQLFNRQLRVIKRKYDYQSCQRCDYFYKPNDKDIEVCCPHCI